MSRSRIHAIEFPEGDHLGDASVSTDGETQVTTDGGLVVATAAVEAVLAAVLAAELAAVFVVLLTGTIPTKPWSPRSLLKASREP